LQAREAAELLLHERMFQHRIDSAPEPGRVLDDAEVAFPGESVECAVTVGEQVHHLGARVFVAQFNRVAQTAGGGVVPVTEPGGQDEDFLHDANDAN